LGFLLKRFIDLEETLRVVQQCATNPKIPSDFSRRETLFHDLFDRSQLEFTAENASLLHESVSCHISWHKVTHCLPTVGKFILTRFRHITIELMGLAVEAKPHGGPWIGWFL
jgi:hypothetical protein